jgi:putative Ca2+/H+ antiporter (TMEM165/GDT1 family)
MGAAKNPFGVMLGGVVGHALCTGLAVVGGKFLATKISERVVLLAGGALFVVFALHSLWAGP